VIKEYSAFNLLKQSFSSASILTHWISDHSVIVKTDASDYVLAAILFIQLGDGEVHPVAFHFRSFNPTKINHDVHNKELYTIFKAFRIWQHYLDSSTLSIDVVTDHKKTWSTS
jgi:hypothetical protein